MIHLKTAGPRYLARASASLAALGLASCGEIPERTEAARGVISGFNLVIAITVVVVVVAVGIIVAAVGLERLVTSRRQLAEQEAEPPEPEEEEEEIAGIGQGRAGVPRWLYAAYIVIPLWALGFVFANVQVETPAEEPTPASTAGEQRVKTEWTIVAENIQFNLDEIVVPPATEVTIVLDNQDAGIPHNVAVYETEAAALEIFVGEIFNGAAEQTYDFIPPGVGQYFFRCDVHPAMQGAFLVEEPAEPPTPGEQVPSEPAEGGAAVTSVEIVAEGIAFDTEEIELAAETEVEIVLDNQDAGIPHNVAIYRTEAATEEIFVGDIFNGVAERTYTFISPEAGEYYFHCDVHPTMEGTAVFR